MAVPAPTTQAIDQAPTKPAPIAAQAAPQKATIQAPAGEAVRLQQPITVVVQRMPEEKKDHSGEFIAGGIGIAGTLIGVAATIAYTEWQRRKDDRVKTDAACNDLYRKLIEIYSFSHEFTSHVRSGVAKAQEFGEANFSPRVQPFANLPERVTFTSEEMNQSRLVVGYDVVNIVPQIERLYAAIVGALHIYRDRFLSIQEIARVESLGEKGVTLSFEEKDALRVRAEFSMMDDLNIEMLEMAEGIKINAFTFILKLIEGLSKYFNRHQGVTITKPDGVVETFEWNLERKGKGKKI